jgi:hypothetical protein
MKLITLIIATIISTSLFVGVMSCSDARKAQQGYKKFIKFGGKIKGDTVVVTVTDTVKGKDGKDSIIYRTVSTVCPEPVFPPTRYEVRYKWKTVHDSLKIVKWKVKYIYKTQKKEIKQEKKNGLAYNLRFIAIISFLVLLIILLFKFK